MTTATWIDQSRLNNNIETIWPTVMGLLKRDLTADHFQRLSQGLRAVRLDDGALTLAIADQDERDWLESRLHGSILKCATEVTSAVRELRFVAGIDSSELHVSDLWAKILAILNHPGLNEFEVAQGLEGIRALGFRHGTKNLVISVPDSHKLNWLKDNLAYAITSALRRVLELEGASEYSSAIPEFVIGDDNGGQDGPDTPSMDLDNIWQSILRQLQLEMPKASFDTWVRDTWVLGFEGGALTIGVRNSYARDWLESRMSSTVSRLLVGVMNRADIALRFVMAENHPGTRDEDVAEEGEDENDTGPIDDGEEVRGRFAYVSQYQEIVKPHRVIVLDGYILRLLPEIGPRRFWTYVGFRQAGWSYSKGAAKKGDLTFRVPVSQIARYAGISRATFFRWMSKKDFWDLLAGLVAKTDEDPQWVVGPDSQKHQAPNEYTVHMTLPLSWADAFALKSWLADQMRKTNLSEALRSALEIPSGQLVGDIFLPIGAQPSFKEVRSKLPVRPLTVIDIARDLSGKKKLSKDDNLLAEALHTKIVTAFGTIAITHYFVEQVIPRAKLTPEQAALVIAARCRCYANPKTGEIRNKVIVGGGFEEMAAWIGMPRIKTVWEWLTGRTDKKELNGGRLVKRQTLKGQGRMPAFIRIEGALQKGATSAAKQLTVRMMEPVFGGTETHKDGGSDTYSNGGTETHRDGGSDTHNNGGTETDLWRNWDGLNDSYNLLITLGITKETITTITEKSAGDSHIPLSWSLGSLLVQNGIYPVNIKKIIAKNVPPNYAVSWLLYCFSPSGANLKPEDTLVSNLLHKDPAETPGEPYDTLAKLPPRLIYELVKATRPYPQTGAGKGTGNAYWDQTVGSANPRIDDLRRRLFGEK